MRDGHTRIIKDKPRTRLGRARLLPSRGLARRRRLRGSLALPSASHIAFAAVVLGVSDAVMAHGGDGHGDHPWWARWNFDPLILTSLVLLVALYTVGLRRLRSRTVSGGRRIGRWQVLAFVGAMVALVIALVSPLDPLSDELSSAHMVQHMILMTVAAPMFIFAAPALVMLLALPATWRRAIGRGQTDVPGWRPSRYLLWQPLAMWSLYLVVLWIWHLPALYEAALRNQWVHELQHLTFFVAACLFWRVLIDPISRLALNRAVGVIYLFTTSLHATVLGVFMALAPTPWYAEYIGKTTAFGLSALEDQQLAGLIMWMPACAIYAIVAAWITGALLLRDREPIVERPTPPIIADGEI